MSRTTDEEEAGEGGGAGDGGSRGSGDGAVFRELFAIVEQRKSERPEGSYTASLLDHEKGENAVLEKLGEELTEVVLAAKDDDRDAVAHESADLVYHLLVLLAAKDMDVEDLEAELRERFPEE